MLNFDRQITISAANNRKATYWPQQTLFWSELVDRLRIPARGTETFAQYLALPKSKQDDLKDVGGFVGGALQNGRRKPNAVLGRDIITFDLDNIPAGGTADILRRIDALGCAYAIYSTRKHEEAKPRLRVLFPADRTVTADEYEPLIRKLASIIDPPMAIFDPTTFQVSRLMYWPSCCSDSQYIFTYGDKPFLSVDGILVMYADWRNVSEWPQVPGAQITPKPGAKQTDPTAKEGIVGAFCKVYNIYQAMETFLPGVYAQTDDPNRFTYTGGSTTGGAVVYDNGTFLYSHHATDPAGGRLVNSFDLVRLHLFGNRDDDAKPETPANRLPSFTAMCQLALSDQTIKLQLLAERQTKTAQDFQAPITIDSTFENNIEWLKQLELNSSGHIESSPKNYLLILSNDPAINCLRFDTFRDRPIVDRDLPWRKVDPNNNYWTDQDDKCLSNYLYTKYGLKSELRMLNALAEIFIRNSFHPIRDYLNNLPIWDGISRVDTLLIDYLGAKDNSYVRAVTRKTLCAAIARVFQPGIKFDYMLVLVGPTRKGKSTLFSKLGKQWFSDNLHVTDMSSKDGSEKAGASWIIEAGELSGMKKADVDAVKGFLSRQVDTYRKAYARRVTEQPRQCVIVGSTNEMEGFLRDTTGNARFWPVYTPGNTLKKTWDLTDVDIDQIWAEALLYWRLAEPLFLPPEIEILAEIAQKDALETDDRMGVIEEYLNKPIPIDWHKRDLGNRRAYLQGFDIGQAKLVPRNTVCVAEIWCECLNCDIGELTRSKSNEIIRILQKIPGWEYMGDQRPYFSLYGRQRAFYRSSEQD